MPRFDVTIFRVGYRFAKIRVEVPNPTAAQRAGRDQVGNIDFSDETSAEYVVGVSPVSSNICQGKVVQCQEKCPARARGRKIRRA